jgi:simple sugar transport system ATP-binding protein
LTLKAVSVHGKSARESLHSVDLTVHAHEIIGIAGVSGNGQVALAALLSGLAAPDDGEMVINGSKITRASPSAMIAHGVGRIPEDRHHDGVVGAMNVAENLIIERLDAPEVQSRGFLRRDAIRDNAIRLSKDYDIRDPGIEARARLLSGGNLQKLILARVFEYEPDLILANQPIRGLDMGAGVVLISEDLDEILSLSDRIIVIHDGHLVEVHSHDREEIGLIMAGEVA